MDLRDVSTACGPLDADVEAVPSKSVTHRAVVTAALGRGETRVVNPLVADDTLATLEAVAALGMATRVTSDAWIVEGCDGRVPGGGTCRLGESGTSLRFMLAVAALGSAPSVLDGVGRLRRRPIEELARVLRDLGGTVTLSPEGGLPASAGGSPLSGGTVSMPSGRSSQFASALLLIAAHLPRGLDLSLEPPVVSLPYVEVTAEVLARFGVAVERLGPLRWRVAPGGFPGGEYRVEGDHSSASYFLAAAAVLGGRVRVVGLDPNSSQADACLGSILQRLGCRVERGADWIEIHGRGKVADFDLDMGHAPDLVPTLAALALFATGACAIRGVPHLRHKESDRLEVLAHNLQLLGRDARAVDDGLIIAPASGRLHGAVISTASDHRMAMAFAIAGLRIGDVSIDDPDCVAKSNPGFWTQLRALGSVE